MPVPNCTVCTCSLRICVCFLCLYASENQPMLASPQTMRKQCGLAVILFRNLFSCFHLFSCVHTFHRKAFKLAFELLQGGARTGCQSIIVFATDGVDNDGDPVRCGPGSYTRSGYVPGQICKYDWSDVWDEVAARNRYMNPRVSY